MSSRAALTDTGKWRVEAQALASPSSFCKVHAASTCGSDGGGDRGHVGDGVAAGAAAVRAMLNESGLTVGDIVFVRVYVSRALVSPRGPDGSLDGLVRKAVSEGMGCTVDSRPSVSVVPVVGCGLRPGAPCDAVVEALAMRGN